MDASELLNQIKSFLQGLPAELSGDDSPLSNVWEEIKYQVQGEQSFYWESYISTMEELVSDLFYDLDVESCESAAEEVGEDPSDDLEICERLIELLLEKAGAEKINYEPFDFEYFTYPLYDFQVYAKVLERTGFYTCLVMAYSPAAPNGESGDVNVDRIEKIIDRDEFEKARAQNWQDEIEDTLAEDIREQDKDIISEVAEEVGISESQALKASEAILKGLHKRLVEYRGGNGDFIGEKACYELSNRGFYHLLGFLEEFFIKYSWDESSASEYLVRVLPPESLEALSEEIKDWNMRNE